MEARYKFMIGVLGADGAKALAKAATRSKPLETVLLPRTILAWLNLATRLDYEGELPGVGNTYIEFAKTEHDTYSGSITIGDEVIPFESSTKAFVAAAIGVSLGQVKIDVDERLRDHDLTRLGKNIDLLAKAHAVAESMDKAEPPGPAAAPTPQDGPAEPVGPTKQPKQPRPPEPQGKQVQAPPAPKRRVKIPGIKAPSVQIAKTQSDKGCVHCGGRMFKDGAFRGCLCFRELAKSVKLTDGGDHYKLSFGTAWDSDAISTLLEALGVS